MKHTIFFLIFLTFNYASSAYASATWQTTQDNQQECNILGQSKLYQE